MLNPRATAFVPPGGGNSPSGGGGGAEAKARMTTVETPHMRREGKSIYPNEQQATPSPQGGSAPLTPTSGSGGAPITDVSTVDQFRTLEASAGGLSRKSLPTAAGNDANEESDLETLRLVLFDDRLLRATLFALEGGVARGFAVPTGPIPPALRGSEVAQAPLFAAVRLTELICDAPYESEWNLTGNLPPVPLLRRAAEEATASIRDERLRKHLVDACNPLHNDAITQGEWEWACEVVGTLGHVCAVAHVISSQDNDNDDRQVDSTRIERLCALRDAVFRHRAAGCFVKCALPLIAVQRLISMELTLDQRDAAHMHRWLTSSLPRCIEFFLTTRIAGGLHRIAEFSAREMWCNDEDEQDNDAKGLRKEKIRGGMLEEEEEEEDDVVGSKSKDMQGGVSSRKTNLSLGAAMLNDAMAAYKHMMSRAMFSSLEAESSVLKSMTGAPSPTTYGGAPTQQAYNAAAAAAKGTEPVRNESTGDLASISVEPDSAAATVPAAEPSTATSAGASPAGRASPPHDAAAEAASSAGSNELEPASPARTTSDEVAFDDEPPIGEATPGQSPTAAQGDGQSTATAVPDPTAERRAAPHAPSTTGTTSEIAYSNDAAPTASSAAATRLDDILSESAKHDNGLMLAFAMVAISECELVTVSTAKRAIEAVELAADGDMNQIDSLIARTKPPALLRDYLAVARQAIDPEAEEHRDLVRHASESVLAREHATALGGQTSRARLTPTPTGGGGISDRSLPNGNNGSNAARARYTKKLPAISPQPAQGSTPPPPPPFNAASSTPQGQEGSGRPRRSDRRSGGGGGHRQHHSPADPVGWTHAAQSGGW